jgi:hypothetical protein
VLVRLAVGHATSVDDGTHSGISPSELFGFPASRLADNPDPIGCDCFRTRLSTGDDQRPGHEVAVLQARKAVKNGRGAALAWRTLIAIQNKLRSGPPYGHIPKLRPIQSFSENLRPAGMLLRPMDARSARNDAIAVVHDGRSELKRAFCSSLNDP